MGGSYFQDGNLGTAYDNLQNLEKALSAALGPAPPGSADDNQSQIYILLKELDWSEPAVKSFLEHVTGSKSAADAFDEAIEDLEKAARLAGAGWTGAASREFQVKLKRLTSNCSAVNLNLEVSSQDLVGVEGEIRKTAERKGATELMDEITDNVKEKAGEIADNTEAAAMAIIYAGGTPADHQTVLDAYEELKNYVDGQIDDIARTVVRLTQKHTGPSDGYKPFHH
jgi:uncharacterized protein YukE